MKSSANVKLNVKEKLGYGFGDFASVLYFQTFMAFLTFFYTDVFLMPVAAAGTMLLVTRTWDWINDPIMGVISDRTETRWGKFRPYLLWLAFPIAFVGWLTFTTPGFDVTGKIIYAYITYTLLMMLYTAINIPYSSLMGVVTANPLERTSLSSTRFVFAYGAGMLISAFLLPMAKFFGGGVAESQRGWSIAFIIIGVVAMGSYLITFFTSTERVRPPKDQKNSIKDDLGDLVKNKPWIILLFVTITFILFVATRINVVTHYFKYYVGDQSFYLFGQERTYGYVAFTSAFHTIGQAVSILGVVFLKRIAAFMGGKKKAFIVMYLVAIISTSLFFVLEPNQVIWMFVLNIIGSFTGSPLSALIWAMYADTADYSEWKQGRRATGLVFSASTMAQKIGWAVGGAIAMFLLSAVGYEANVEQNENVLTGLKSLMSIIPGAIGLISLALLGFYKLNEERMNEIAEDLEKRRGSDGEGQLSENPV